MLNAFATMAGNQGQANYTAANAILDSISHWSRQGIPQIAATNLLWGPVGDIGMRWKSFATADALDRGAPADMDFIFYTRDVVVQLRHVHRQVAALDLPVGGDCAVHKTILSKMIFPDRCSVATDCVCDSGFLDSNFAQMVVAFSSPWHRRNR